MIRSTAVGAVSALVLNGPASAGTQLCLTSETANRPLSSLSEHAATREPGIFESKAVSPALQFIGLPLRRVDALPDQAGRGAPTRSRHESILHAEDGQFIEFNIDGGAQDHLTPSAASFSSATPTAGSMMLAGTAAMVAGGRKPARIGCKGEVPPRQRG